MFCFKGKSPKYFEIKEYIYLLWTIFFIAVLISVYLIGASHNRGKMLNQSYKLPWHHFLVIHLDSKTVLIESIHTKVRFLINRSVVQGHFKTGDTLKKIDYRSEEFDDRKLKHVGFPPLIKVETKNAD